MQYSYLFPIHQLLRVAECPEMPSRYAQGLFHLWNCHTCQYLDRAIHLDANNITDPSQSTSPYKLFIHLIKLKVYKKHCLHSLVIHLHNWTYFTNHLIYFSYLIWSRMAIKTTKHTWAWTSVTSSLQRTRNKETVSKKNDKPLVIKLNRQHLETCARDWS